MRFWPAWFIALMRVMRRASTNGPFFADLLKRLPPASRMLAALAATDDELVGALVVRPGAVTECGHAPRRDRMAPGGGLALAAAVRMVDRVHGRAAHGRAHAAPAGATGFAAVDVRVVGN